MRKKVNLPESIIVVKVSKTGSVVIESDDLDGNIRNEIE